MQTPKETYEAASFDSAINLDQLNPAQYEAVTHTTGPILVIAGAGSGKTRTLVYRVAYLLEQGVQPENILLLTFTRKAAQEMLWRAGRLVQERCSRVTGGTFHGIGNMLLRRYGRYLNFGSTFSIIDRADAEGIVNLLKSSLGLVGRDKRFPSKRIVVNMISGSVNKSMEIEDIIFDQYPHLSEHLDDILALRKHYQEFKRDNGLMDYDDLLVNWKRLMEEEPQARQEISTRFHYVMVDEYQDTNLIQADIVRLVAGDHRNVMVVGDDSQSIYSFRGADFYNIMRFPKTYDGARIIKLEENYRSSQPILSLTNDIIRNAVDKYTKTLFTRIEGNVRPKLYGGRNEMDEAGFVAGKIKELMAEGVEPGEIAVLFRSGFHSYKLEMELNGSSLEFEKRGGLKMTESAHMKDVLSFLRLLINPRDNLSWNRILLQLNKVGPKTAQKIVATISLEEDPFTALGRYPAGKTWKQGLEKMVALFGELRDGDKSPGVLYETCLNYYQPTFERIYKDDYPKRQKDLDQLKGIIVSYKSLQDFIDDTTLDPPDTASEQQTGETDRLILSTIHSAKGLEWQAVFVIGLADGRFPHASAFGYSEQWEEERRLLYVAATRARKYLFLSYPRTLMTADRQFKRVGMSPFLAELKAGLYERLEEDAPSFIRDRTPKPPVAEKKLPVIKRKTPLMSQFTKGCTVNHPFFGEGVVQGKSGEKTLDVLFDRHGLKALHLDYAKLKLVE